MIELNCTYEESKKILELGYDFSKICDFAWVTMNINETPVLVCQNLEIQYLLFAQKIYDFQAALTKKQPIEIIPIVPKAALEACLPTTLNLTDYLGNLDLSSFAKRFSCGVIDLYSIMQKGVTHEWFTTAYEAFIWCHENYPEELKKKFEEVMK